MTSWTPATDPTRLAPEDAYLKRPTAALPLSGSPVRSAASLRRARDQQKKRSRSKRQQTTWKKLLWVKQSCIGVPTPHIVALRMLTALKFIDPDNYTDEATFLDALQRNPRLAPYQFWPLVADTTVIVQQLCTVVVFACCFAGIVQERLSPVTLVRWSTAGAVLGWFLWDVWVGKVQEQATKDANGVRSTSIDESNIASRPASHQAAALASEEPTGLSQVASSDSSEAHSQNTKSWTANTRNQQRLATAKSAILIYCALLGLSPILKSLTKSTSSDSIWAISFWLLCLNVVFFDYSGGDVGATFPASLSTNAALMAATVLASRLPSTTHVFSLTLFSIEVFGLFPIFRRYLRRVSWRGHLALTWLLVISAGSGAAVSFSGGGWSAAIAGAVLGCVLTGLAMGVCSWWLIGLQRYKNEIHGPWDAARPVVRSFD